MASSLPLDLWPYVEANGILPHMAQEPTGVADVAGRLRTTREALKLTQARLCAITGISTAAWNNAETGDARIGVDNAILLCQAFGVTLDWIFRGVRGGLPSDLSEKLNRPEPPAKKKRLAVR